MINTIGSKYVAINEMTSNTLRPVYNADPDMRFATTFISNKYRDYAVKGEVLMDKATGEIFTKRPEDGRVVSFYQNKKYMSELMLDLRIMLNNNGSFRYPSEASITACYLSTDYDMMSLYENKDKNITTGNHVIPNGSESVTKLQFNVSSESNGFFCRLSSRDSDKSVIEYITNQYNSFFKNYTGTNTAFIAEKNKLETIEKWADSNATINYTVIITTGSNVKNFQVTDYIRINEESCVLFPDSIPISSIENADLVTVKINSFTYDKIQFMIKNKSTIGSAFTTGLTKFMYPDNSIFIRYCNICSFIDSDTDVRILGNEFIIALMDIPFVRRYMMKMSKLTTSSDIIVSPSRPSEDVWGTNGIWAEQIRDVFKGGYTIDMDCEVDLKKLESYIAENEDVDYVNFSTTANTTDIYIRKG